MPILHIETLRTKGLILQFDEDGSRKLLRSNDQPWLVIPRSQVLSRFDSLHGNFKISFIAPRSGFDSKDFELLMQLEKKTGRYIFIVAPRASPVAMLGVTWSSPKLPRSQIPYPPWLEPVFEKMGKYATILDEALADEYKTNVVFPPPQSVFTAFYLTPFEKVNAIILGQDPYHTLGVAHGLAFSCLGKAPPSLVNIFKELARTGFKLSSHDERFDITKPWTLKGDLSNWCLEGVLLLNTALTVRSGKPGSHMALWSNFTSVLLSYIASECCVSNAVILAWGKPAQQSAKIFKGIAEFKVVECGHPSPLNTRELFVGSNAFLKANEALRMLGKRPLKWAVS